MKKVIIKYTCLDHDNQIWHCHEICIHFPFNHTVTMTDVESLIKQLEAKKKDKLNGYVLMFKCHKAAGKEINMDGNLVQVRFCKEIHYKYSKGTKPQPWYKIFQYRKVHEEEKFDFDPSSNMLKEFNPQKNTWNPLKGGSMADNVYAGDEENDIFHKKYKKYKNKYNYLKNRY